jgi:predicted naringenin-chalcone synthase
MTRLLPLTGIEKRYLATLETQADLDEPDGLYRRSAEQPRGPSMEARSQAFDAASDRLVRRVLAPLNVDGLDRVSALVTVSCTHASSPGLERAVYRHSAVPGTSDRWNLGFMGCSAALSALRLAHHAPSIGTMLVVCCELSSLHFQYSTDMDQLTANLLFADGAAAALIDDTSSPIRLVHAGCATVPDFAEQMVWWAGDFGLRLALSPDLPATLAAYLPGAVDRFLAEAGVSRNDIDHWLIHPGGPQILDAAGQALDLAHQKLSLSRTILRDFGNMSSPTILFILRAALEAGTCGRVLLAAFGPGLTIELVLMEIAAPAAAATRGPAVLVDPA